MPLRLLLLALCLPSCLVAQLHLTARVGVASHAGHALDEVDPEHPAFKPATTLDAALAIGLDAGRWRFVAQLRREVSDLVLVGKSSGIITRDALSAWHAGLEVGRRMLGADPAPELYLLGGAGITRWSFPGFDDPPRSRAVAWVALDGSLPLTARIHGVLRTDLATGGGLFRSEDLPEGYASRTAWRLGVSVGLRVRP